MAIRNKHFLQKIMSKRYSNLILLYDEIIFFTFLWMKKNNIKIVNLPITTQSVSSPMGLGSDSLPYKVKETESNFEFYLADSMQFYLELLLRAQNVDKIGYISWSFREEKVDKRHLHQFSHFEIEIVGNLGKVKKTAISYIKFILKKLIDKKPDLLNYFSSKNKKILEKWMTKKVKTLKYKKALRILKKNFLEGVSVLNYEEQKMETINSLGENFLIKYFENNILWLEDFPYQLTPFYQKINLKSGTSRDADLLIGIEETVGSGERVIDYKEAAFSLDLHQNSKQNYGWYLEMKKEKLLFTAGFGIGLERLLLFFIGEKDIRKVQLIPREKNKGDLL